MRIYSKTIQEASGTATITGVAKSLDDLLTEAGVDLQEKTRLVRIAFVGTIDSADAVAWVSEDTANPASPNVTDPIYQGFRYKLTACNFETFSIIKDSAASDFTVSINQLAFEQDRM